MGTPRAGVAVVTGATGGLGLETARRLSQAGYRVVIVGRDGDKAERVAAELEAQSPQQQASEIALADLSVLADVSRLADELAARHPRIDVLVNNAGVDVGRRTMTADGVELTFAVNYLAPVSLSLRLAEPMARARGSAGSPARIVNVASSGHRGGRFDPDDLEALERRPGRFVGQRAYNDSKLALVEFTGELARRSDPSLLVAHCADPGFVRGTGLGRELPRGYLLVGALMTPFMATVEKGARSIVWAATDAGAAERTGGYVKGGRFVAPSRDARDPQRAARLWESTHELLRRHGVGV